jgi:site-specific DNA recombinase
MNNINIPSQPFFLYARKSTDTEDMQVLSIESQLAELREFAAREKIFIVEELVEKQSAKIPGRPIFNRMIDRIEKGEASGIVSWHPDRLARNSVDGGRLIYLVDTGKIKFLKFPQFWFESTPQGKFMLNIAFGQSKYFVDSLSENTKRGLRQKVRRGEMPGVAPPGYINDSRTKTIIIDRRRAPIIKELFEKFATGKYSLIDMAVFLAQHGITTTGGKILRDKTSWILSNPFYYGHFRYAGEIHEGSHEPLISKKLFDAVQEVWRRRSRSWHDKRPVKPYTGLFRCGECGMMVTAEYKTKYYPSTNHHATYVYYRCTKKSLSHKCFQPFVREEELDRQLSAMIQTVSLPQDWAGKIMKKLDQEKVDNAQSCFAFVADKQKEINVITTKLQRLLDSYLDQDIDREEYRIRKAKLLSEKKTLEESVTHLQQTQNAWLEPMRTWVKEASEATKIARGEDKNAKKVLAQKIFGSNLTLTHKIARGDAREPWAALRAAPTSRKLERAKGIEPSSYPWEGYILPVYYARTLETNLAVFLQLFSPYCVAKGSDTVTHLRDEFKFAK